MSKYSSHCYEWVSGSRLLGDYLFNFPALFLVHEMLHWEDSGGLLGEGKIYLHILPSSIPAFG